MPRLVLLVGLGLYVGLLAGGALGPDAWGWKRVTLLATALFALFVSATVPDHFLRDHLWRHVVQKHVPRIFLWTLGALVVLAVLNEHLDLHAAVASNRWLVLVVAGLVGLIPESGPHLVFVTLYASGGLPLGILAASSAVQDGHGMLPLLAYSRTDFVRIKLVNLVVGLALGAVMLALSA